jgi:hypothetical protein
MEPTDQAWDYFTKIPALLNQYGGYSKPLLLLLLAGGALGVAALLVLKIKGKHPPSSTYWLLCVGLAFFSTGGLYLKEMGRRDQKQAYAEFVRTHRFAAGQIGIVVFEFNLPPEADVARRAKLLGHMPLLVHTVSDVLLDDLPEEFSMPRVLGVSTRGSPWQEVTQQNFTEVIEQLNARQIMWGVIYDKQARDMAKVSLGIRAHPRHRLDAVIPLEDVLLDEDPRAEHQFGDGRFQLLGAVTLGIALQTYEEAQQATGEERRKLLLRVAQQITKARETLNSRSDDPALKRTIYSSQVSELLTAALQEAGVQL